MKFEFDHRTGTMQPKKDDQIYFAKSQGGGLIVDDKKNNVKFIIERDETITKLFGSFNKSNLNFYDMRDARMISDRVIRLFGRDHKYSDFHYFLKGYHMNENFVQKMSDFLDESVWADLHKRSNGEIRKEEGRKIGVLEDGTTLVIGSDAFEDGDLVKFDDNLFFTFYKKEREKIYVAVIENKNTYVDTYYMYDENTEEKVNMVKCFEADSSVRTENDFGVLRVLMEQDEFDADDLIGLTVGVSNVRVTFKNDYYCFFIYEDKDQAIQDAEESEKDFLESEEFFGKDTVRRYRDALGDDFFDEKGIKDDLRESYESYYNDLDQDEAISELLNSEIIVDSDDYFELDEDGETDHSLPTFDYRDYCDRYVDARMDDISDYVDEYISTYGYDGIETYIKYGRLAELIVKKDGPASILAGYDNIEREARIDYTTYYVYRAN